MPTKVTKKYKVVIRPKKKEKKKKKSTKRENILNVRFVKNSSTNRAALILAFKCKQIRKKRKKKY